MHQLCTVLYLLSLDECSIRFNHQKCPQMCDTDPRFSCFSTSPRCCRVQKVKQGQADSSGRGVEPGREAISTREYVLL